MSFASLAGPKLAALCRWALAAVTLLGVSHTLATAASDRTQTEQVAWSLIASHQQVAPGGNLQVGLRQEIAPHWHTYWVNPGDSGMPTQVTWTLPPGWKALDLAWPTPTRFDLGPITNHGYEHTAVLLQTLQVPANAQVGDRVTLEAELSWLVCKEVCIPQQAKLAVQINVSSEAQIQAENQALLHDAAKRLAAMAGVVATGLEGGSWMTWHARLGQAVGLLLAFRLTWGLWGHGTARFASFWPTPSRLLAYLKGRWQGIGHNPLGALSVLVMLGVLGLQVLSGLLSNDELGFTGPWADLVSEEWQIRLTGWHHLNVNLIYGLVAVHVAAIAFHRWVKRHDLLTPMLSGQAAVPADPPRPRQAGRAALPLSLVLTALVAWSFQGHWVSQASHWLASEAPPEAPQPSGNPEADDLKAEPAQAPATTGAQPQPSPRAVQAPSW